LSFGSETGRTRSGTKGFSSKQKKLKRKKQDYHVHRRGHLQEAQQLDLEEVRARTILALDRLGHQVLSTEGGYDLQDWMKSLDSLLDDFQEKVGADQITEEFRARRQAAVLPLASPAAVGDTDVEIENATQEEVAARAALAELEKKAAEKLASLRDERDACGRDLKLEKERLDEIREAKQSRQFFSRLVRAGPSTEQPEKRIEELEAKLSRLEEEIDRSRKVRSALASSSAGEGHSAYPEAEQRLEDARDKLISLQEARKDKIQLTKEREAATKTISELISSMTLEGPPSGRGAVQEQ